MRADLMALELLTTTAFEKDMRRARKQGTGGGPIAGALQPASVTRGLDGTLGLPRGTGLATTLQADRETTGACSHRQPYRIVRMNGRSQLRPLCVAGPPWEWIAIPGYHLHFATINVMSSCCSRGLNR